VRVAYDDLRFEPRDRVPDELVPEERDPDGRELVDRDGAERALVRVPPERVDVLLDELLVVEDLLGDDRLVDRAGFLSGVTAALSLSRSLSTPLLAFLASRCKARSALVTSLYAVCAPRPTSWPTECSAAFASSSSFSTRCVVRSTSRRVAADVDVLLRAVERVVERDAAVVLRVAGLRAAGFLAGGIAVSLWGAGGDESAKLCATRRLTSQRNCQTCARPTETRTGLQR
jgi:hypothetical protein